MPKAANPNLFEIYCYKCRKITENCEPCSIKKLPGIEGKISNNYHVKIGCKECNKIKSKKLNKKEISHLPKEIIDAAINTNHTEVIRDGKAFPIAEILKALLPVIIAAAPTVIDFVKSKFNGGDLKDRTLKEIFDGGEISENELKDMMQIFGGLGFEIIN